MPDGVVGVERLVVEHAERLSGEVAVQGSKNSALPILTATLLCDGICTIENCPDLSDVDVTLEILKGLGAKVLKEKNSVIVDSTEVCGFKISKEMMKKIRSSILFLGALSARMGRAELCVPGGCKLGPRPIDWHLAALSHMGLKIENQDKMLFCELEDRFKGAEITLPLPSVGATENIILAAVLAKGTTIIRNAAREPEICDLCDFLIKCGARIEGAGQSEVRIVGVERLSGTEHRVIPDRIVAVTFLAAAAAVGGDVTVQSVAPAHMQSMLDVFKKIGCDVNVAAKSVKILAKDKKLAPIREIVTKPYPGFPTDAQALFMVLASISDGSCMFVENIFKNRYKHAEELVKMGADIKVMDKIAVVKGVDELCGEETLEAKDLRGAAALVIAAMAADGRTTITGVEHLDRGYEDFEQNLRRLGANIKRI